MQRKQGILLDLEQQKCLQGEMRFMTLRMCLGPAVLSASVITGDRNGLWEGIPDKMLNSCAEVLWGFSWSIVPIFLGT